MLSTISPPATLSAKNRMKIQIPTRFQRTRRLRAARVSCAGLRAPLAKRLAADLPFGPLGPQALDIVKRAFFGHEHVDDDVAEVDEDPSSVGVSFDPRNCVRRCFGRLDDRIGNGARLNFGAARDDDEGVGQNRTPAHVDRDGVFAFLGKDCVADDVAQLADAETSSRSTPNASAAAAVAGAG